jgi:hypothetical protein
MLEPKSLATARHMNTQDRQTERVYSVGDTLHVLICAGIAVNGFQQSGALSRRL